MIDNTKFFRCILSTDTIAISMNNGWRKIFNGKNLQRKKYKRRKKCCHYCINCYLVLPLLMWLLLWLWCHIALKNKCTSIAFSVVHDSVAPSIVHCAFQYFLLSSSHFFSVIFFSVGFFCRFFRPSTSRFFI